MDFVLAGTVILSGVGIVFLVLVVLTLIVSLFGKVMSRGSSKPDAGTTKVVSAPPPQKAAPTAPPAPMQASQDDIPEEVIAVISAAVSAVMGSEGFVIKSVKRAKEAAGSRNPWSLAGMMHNTAPF